MFQSQSVSSFFSILLRLTVSLSAGGICFSSTTQGADATFIHIGFLPGDDHSGVEALDEAGAVAVGYSYHRDPAPPYGRIFNFAIRWTPLEGIQPLPLLPNTLSDEPVAYFVSGKDVTADGKTLLYVSPTHNDEVTATGLVAADGSNPMTLSALPNGDSMPTANQISDDGSIVFGYLINGFDLVCSLWTATDGIRTLIPPPGISSVEPSSRAISADGSVSVGTLARYDQSPAIIESYRWTPSGGFKGLGLLPGGTYSTGLAVTPDGSVVLGAATSQFTTDLNYANLFLWNEDSGMVDLGRPYSPGEPDPYGQFSSGSLNSDGTIAAVASIYGDSYIVNTAGKYFFSFPQLMIDAGLENSIEGWSNFFIFGMTTDARVVYGEGTNPAGEEEGFIVQFEAGFLRNFPVPPLPVITSDLEVSGMVGEPFFYQITATNDPTRYAFDELYYLPDLVFDYDTGTISGTFQRAGDFPFAIYAYNENGYDRKLLTLHVAEGAPVAKVLNLATRLQVLTGDNVPIGGFIITGDLPKKIVLRAIGPSLADLGIAAPLADPILELHAPGGTIMTNDDWRATQESEITAAKLAPSDDRESAISAFLGPGSYTAVVRGKDGATGVGLVEVYDLDEVAASKVANISTRGFVGTNEDVLIGGLIIAEASADVVVRGIGPSLSLQDVTGVLADPTLEIHNADGSILASNDNWKSAQRTEIEASGLAPTNDLESAIRVTLPPASYTAIVSGKGATTGIGLVEVYNLEPYNLEPTN